jgi:hypothetical protein
LAGREAEDLARWVRSCFSPGSISYAQANQDDLQERSQQVKLMFSLHSHAARVLIWPGEAQDEIDLTMDLVCQLQSNRLDSVLKQYPQATFTR